MLTLFLNTTWRLLAVPVLMMALVYVLPTLLAVLISLFDYQHSLVSPGFCGWQNFQRLVSQPGFWHSLQTTVAFTAVTLPAMLFLPIPLAVLLKPALTGMGFYRLLAYVPVVAPLVAISIAWSGLYATDGVFNQWLTHLGLGKVPWLTHPDVALWAIVAMVIWKGLAYYGMLYLTRLLEEDPQLAEAGRLDGANAWQCFWHLTLPGLKPVMGVVGLICMLGCFKAFTEFYVMTRGGPLGSTTTWLYWIYHNGFERLDLGLASAGGLLLMGVLGILAWGQQRWLSPSED
jgi:putative chitobiose transport system permease protein